MRRIFASAGLMAAASLMAVPLPVLSADPSGVWQPTVRTLSAVVPLEGTRIWSWSRGGRIKITGERLLPVILEKGKSGTEEKVGLSLSSVAPFDHHTALFTGRLAGGDEVERIYGVKIEGHAFSAFLDFTESSYSSPRWTNTTIEGVLGMPPGLYRVSIWGPLTADGRPAARSGPISNGFDFRVYNADYDRDGHETMEAGGDDCNDADRNRYPGRSEVADFTMHDEDCDGETIGNLDRDADGFIDARVCNWLDYARFKCGDDCDDNRRGVHPIATEACNEIDDDCDGIIDEGLVSCESSSAGETVSYEGPQLRNRPPDPSGKGGAVVVQVGPIVAPAPRTSDCCVCPSAKERTPKTKKK
jgi:hypothetical protein